MRVYSGRELGQLQAAVGTPGLSEVAMKRVVHQEEGRCRDVVPLLRKGKQRGARKVWRRLIQTGSCRSTHGVSATALGHKRPLAAVRI